MTPKLKFHLKWAVPVGIVILLGLVFLSQTPQVISATVSPEAVLVSTTKSQTLLSFNLKIKSSLPVWGAFLKSLATTTSSSKVLLDRQTEGGFTGSYQVSPELLKKPQTITFSLYVNGLKTATVVRFAITDTSITLPPDPGEAGKATLAGIDSDNDGVRDDLQREIVFMYPGNDEVRRVLRAMVKKEQDVITTTGDHEHYKELMVSVFTFQDCYNHLVFGTGLRDYSNSDKLWYMVKNTPERKKVFEDNDTKGKPYITPVGSIYSCENVKDQY